MVARGKPAPDVYLEAMRRLGCNETSRWVQNAVYDCKESFIGFHMAMRIFSKVNERGIQCAPFKHSTLKTCYLVLVIGNTISKSKVMVWHGFKARPHHAR